MKRSRPLQRKTWPKRSKPMKRVNSKRKAERRAEQFGRQAELCRESQCCVCAHYDFPSCGPVEPHHEPPRGMSNKSGDADTIPLGRLHHRQRHDMGVESFWTMYAGVDWRAVRDEMRRRAAAT